MLDYHTAKSFSIKSTKSRSGETLSYARIASSAPPHARTLCCANFNAVRSLLRALFARQFNLRHRLRALSDPPANAMSFADIEFAHDVSHCNPDVSDCPIVR
jgi:hypothetical protein